MVAHMEGEGRGGGGSAVGFYYSTYLTKKAVRQQRSASMRMRTNAWQDGKGSRKSTTTIMSQTHKRAGESASSSHSADLTTPSEHHPFMQPIVAARRSRVFHREQIATGPSRAGKLYLGVVPGRRDTDQLLGLLLCVSIPVFRPVSLLPLALLPVTVVVGATVATLLNDQRSC